MDMRTHLMARQLGVVWSLVSRWRQFNRKPSVFVLRYTKSESVMKVQREFRLAHQGKPLDNVPSG